MQLRRRVEHFADGAGVTLDLHAVHVDQPDAAVVLYKDVAGIDVADEDVEGVQASRGFKDVDGQPDEMLAGPVREVPFEAALVERAQSQHLSGGHGHQVAHEARIEVAGDVERPANARQAHVAAEHPFQLGQPQHRQTVGRVDLADHVGLVGGVDRALPASGKLLHQRHASELQRRHGVACRRDARHREDGVLHHHRGGGQRERLDGRQGLGSGA